MSNQKTQEELARIKEVIISRRRSAARFLAKGDKHSAAAQLRSANETAKKYFPDLVQPQGVKASASPTVTPSPAVQQPATMSPEAVLAMKTLIQGAAGQGTVTTQPQHTDSETEAVLRQSAWVHNNRHTRTNSYNEGYSKPLQDKELESILAQAVRNHELGALADEQLAAVDEGQEQSSFTLPEDEMQAVLASAAETYNRSQGIS